MLFCALILIADTFIAQLITDILFSAFTWIKCEMGCDTIYISWQSKQVPCLYLPLPVYISPLISCSIVLSRENCTHGVSDYMIHQVMGKQGLTQTLLIQSEAGWISGNRKSHGCHLEKTYITTHLERRDSIWLPVVVLRLRQTFIYQ